MSRFAIAMSLFVLLAVLSWQTLSDERIRAVTLLLLGLFAFRSWIHHRRESDAAKRDIQ